MSNFSNMMPSWGGGGMTSAYNPNANPYQNSGYYNQNNWSSNPNSNYFQPY